MAEKYSPEAEDDQLPEQRASQQRLLLLLLLLILLFAYLYFFTGLIRPKPEAPKPEPAAQPQMVKKPLPPRVAENEAAPEVKPAAQQKKAGAKEPKAEAPEAGKPQPGAAAKGAKNALPPKAEAAKHEPPAAAPAKPGAKPAAKEAKPAPKEAKPVIEKKPAKPVAQASPAGIPAAAGKALPQQKGAETAAAAAAKKGAAKGTAAKGAKETAQAEAARPAKARAPKAAAKVAAGRYALVIDKDLAASEIAPVVSKLKRAGVGHVVTSKAQKGEQMHRLFLADFGNHEEAQEELERLKLAAPGAFMLKENGRYAVYAGSYLREGKAAVEQDRLYAKGVKLILKSATAPVPVVKLRAGSFADQASAEKVAGRLKQEGIAAKVVKSGK